MAIDIGRREFVAALGGAAIWPLAARAQGQRLRRIGVLMPFPPTDAEERARVDAMQTELRRLGWSRGNNIEFDERWTTDSLELIRTNAANLVELKPDVIVALGGRVIPILLQLTPTIPIVLPGAVDPIGTGWVKSLARPGGNLTGFTLMEFSMFGKLLDLLKQIAPDTTRIGLLFNPDNPSNLEFRREIATFAGPLAIEPIDFPIHGLSDIDRAIATLAEQPKAAVFFLPDITIQAIAPQVVELVRQHRLPTIYTDLAYVKAGGLAFYGVDRMDLFRQAAGYVDRILRGEKPGELPFQQPTKYRLVINLKAAKALGLNLPPALLAGADDVIE
jgi:putative tryptophan/tyrosine transport system substrate-binding protein